MCAPDPTAREATLPFAALIALAAMPVIVRAADTDVLDEDFLDYLAEFEDEDDDWSWFDGEDKPSSSERSPNAPRDVKSKEKVEP